jgi:methionyl-tRNA formyltransferase
VNAVVFAYHEIGYACLDELLRFGATVQCLFTHEDDPAEEIWFRRPHLIARVHGIPVYTNGNLKDPAIVGMLKNLNPDTIFSFYYRKLIPGEILRIPKIGAFNLHGSLLPRFRGRCPVNWVLIEGEAITGLTLHVMEEKADSGDIVAQRAIDIDFQDTAHSLFLKMVQEARVLMRETLPALAEGTFKRIPQEGPSSYFGRRKPEDGRIDWEKDARAIYNLVRATTHPYPGAFTYLGGRKLLIWGALPEERVVTGPPGRIVSPDPWTIAAGNGVVRLTRVQLEGEEEMDGNTFVETHPLNPSLLGGRS